MLTDVFIAAIAVTTVVAVANWVSRARTDPRLEAITKPLATIGAITVALAAGAATAPTAWAVGALVLCLIGDIALLPSVDRFLVGLGAFLVGHLAFVGMFAHLGFDAIPLGGLGLTLAAVVVGTAGLAIVAGATRRGMRNPVLAYLVVISVMCVAGWATGNWLAALGASAFVVSDAILGTRMFVGERTSQPVAIMVTYHVAIVALAASLTLA